MKLTFYFSGVLLYLILSTSCGNPAIRRYLETENFLPKKESHDASEGKDKYILMNKNGISIYIKNVSYQDIDELSKRETQENASFRIPSLTYLEFFIYNNSDSEIKANFFKATLADPDKNLTPVLLRDDFYKEYTSVAYKNFNYDKIFSLYTVEYQGLSPKKGFYYEKFSPGQTGILKPGYSSRQIIPFKRISERNREYTLSVPLGNVDETIIVPLHYIVERADRPEK